MNRLLAGIAIALPIAFINDVMADETLTFDSFERIQTTPIQEVSEPIWRANHGFSFHFRCR